MRSVEEGYEAEVRGDVVISVRARRPAGHAGDGLCAELVGDGERGSDVTSGRRARELVPPPVEVRANVGGAQAHHDAIAALIASNDAAARQAMRAALLGCSRRAR